MEFKELDPILHSNPAGRGKPAHWRAGSRVHLSEKKTNATAGNLSVQINKLKDAGYIK